MKRIKYLLIGLLLLSSTFKAISQGDVEYKYNARTGKFDLVRSLSWLQANGVIGIGLNSFSATAPISYNNSTGVFTLNSTTVGSNLLSLTNPSAITFLKISATNTVTTESASVHRTSLGATTAGSNLFTITNPSAITFLKFNADNTVTTESASVHRTSLGATTVGSNLFTLANPSAISFLRVNADNTITAQTAANFKTDLSLNNVTNVAQEAALGNPASNGYVLSSTTGGVRSWIAPPAGGSMVYPSGSGIPVVSSGTSWGTTLANTTVGTNLLTLTNPSAISFLRVNADNTVTAQTAANFKTDLSLNNVTNVAQEAALDNPANDGYILTSTALGSRSWINSSNMGGYATTATAAGTTTLTVASSRLQVFTGSTTQTVVLPVASTLALGHVFEIYNLSTGVLTINSSGANLVLTLAASSKAEIICVITSGTTAASWSAFLQPNTTTTGAKLNLLTSIAASTGTATTNIVFSTSPALTTPTVVTSIVGGASFAAFNTVSTTLNMGGAATTMTLGGTPTTAITHSYSANATANATTKTVNIATGGAAGSTTNVNIGSSTASAILGNFTLGFPTILQSSNYTNLDLFNTQTTTLNLGGAATTMSLGGTPTTAITHNYSANATATATTKTINFGTGGASGSTTALNMGSASGTTYAAIGGAYNSSYTLYVYGTIYATGAITSNSDTTKKTIYGRVPDVLGSFSSIKLIDFTFKNDKLKKRHFGYSAQNLNSLFPTVAVHNSDNSYELDHLGISAINTKAIQELLELNKQQQNEINDLKERLDKIEKLLFQ